MPLPAIYNVIIPLLIILSLGLVFFSSVFLYNKLCEKKLLSFDEDSKLQPVKKVWGYILIFVLGLVTSLLFYYLIINDSLDFTLILLIPPLFVALLCELKNGFSPPVSVFFIGLCVLVRITYYCVFQGISYGLSILLSFAIVFAVVFIPKYVLRRADSKPLEISAMLIFSLIGSYFSPIYAIVYVSAVYFLMTLGYELPNYIANKRKGCALFTFRVPLIFVGTAVAAAMLFV